MKRVLIISYYWPPSGGAGVQRWLKFVKYLRGFGWEPVLYIPENPEYPETDHSLAKDIPENLEILRQPIWEPYDLYKKLIGQKKGQKINAAFLTEKKKNKTLENISVWIRGNFFIPDARKYWIKPSIRFLQGYLLKNRIDAIVSTGPPHSMHLIAMPLSKQFHIPWLADFRDPWTNIDFYSDLRLTAAADRKHHQLEREVLAHAHAVTVISETMAGDFSRVLERRYEVITNGFDWDDVAGDEKIDMDKKFSIAHIGTLVQTRNPVTLWKALQELTLTNPTLAGDLEIKLVGKVDISVMETLAQFGLTSYIKRIDYMPHDQVVRCQQQSQVLLLIINNTPNAKMILTGKFFEYLAAQRPILCLGPGDGDAAAILTRTNAGLLANWGDVTVMRDHLLTLYGQYKNGTLGTQSQGIDSYSRQELTGKLAAVLDHITG